MPETEMTFFVVRREKKEVERKTIYILRFGHGAGHYLVLKGDSESLFEGYPIGQAVTLKFLNPQQTLPKQ